MFCTEVPCLNEKFGLEIRSDTDDGLSYEVKV